MKGSHIPNLGFRLVQVIEVPRKAKIAELQDRRLILCQQCIVKLKIPASELDVTGSLYTCGRYISKGHANDRNGTVTECPKPHLCAVK